MNREPNIPVTKIISAACRNFMAFEGLHNFEFDEAISQALTFDVDLA